MQEICTHYEIFTHGPNKLSRLIPLKSKRNERTVHLGQGQSKWSWHKCKRYVAVYEHRANKLYTRLAQMQEICTQNPFTLLQSMICMNPLQKKKTSFECDQLQNNVTFILSWTEIAHKAKIYVSWYFLNSSLIVNVCCKSRPLIYQSVSVCFCSHYTDPWDRLLVSRWRLHEYNPQKRHEYNSVTLTPQDKSIHFLFLYTLYVTHKHVHWLS